MGSTGVDGCYSICQRHLFCQKNTIVQVLAACSKPIFETQYSHCIGTYWGVFWGAVEPTHLGFFHLLVERVCDGGNHLRIDREFRSSRIAGAVGEAGCSGHWHVSPRELGAKFPVRTRSPMKVRYRGGW